MPVITIRCDVSDSEAISDVAPRTQHLSARMAIDAAGGARGYDSWLPIIPTA